MSRDLAKELVDHIMKLNPAERAVFLEGMDRLQDGRLTDEGFKQKVGSLIGRLRMGEVVGPADFDATTSEVIA